VLEAVAGRQFFLAEERLWAIAWVLGHQFTDHVISLAKNFSSEEPTSLISVDLSSRCIKWSIKLQMMIKDYGQLCAEDAQTILVLGDLSKAIIATRGK
jgi:hypothetical protein